jgi:ABC-type Na+ efflux pump permease subunit
VLLVARRELIERARSPAFIVSLAISVLVIGAVVVLPSLFAEGTRQVALIDAEATAMEDLSRPRRIEQA